MSQGDEGNSITYDEARGVVLFAKQGRVRACHISNCAWVEYVDDAPLPAPVVTKK